MKILITCFDPFGNMEINASRAVLDRIDTYKFDAEIIKLEIPTVRYKSLEMIQKEIENCHPDVVISLGQAGGRAGCQCNRYQRQGRRTAQGGEKIFQRGGHRICR